LIGERMWLSEWSREWTFENRMQISGNFGEAEEKKGLEWRVTWAWFGGVDFEEKDDNAEKMGHVPGEPEDVHGFALTRETQRKRSKAEKGREKGRERRNETQRKGIQMKIAWLCSLVLSYFLFIFLIYLIIIYVLINGLSIYLCLDTVTSTLYIDDGAPLTSSFYFCY